MLKLFNHTNDQSLFDYGLILGSVTILGFSVYYFSNIIFNPKINGNLPNLNNPDITIDNIVNNLNTYPITGSDTLVPKLDTFVEASLYKVNTSIQTNESSLNKIDASIQAGSGILNRTDIDVTRYTDEGLFIPWDGNLKSAMQELLYGMASDTQSISDISPTEFANHIRNNENYSRYFDKIHNWVDSVPPHVASSNGRYSSELNFLMDVRKALDTVPNSPVDLIINSDQNSLLDKNIQILLEKINSNLYNQGMDSSNMEQLKTVLDLYSITLTDSNIDTVALLLSLGPVI